MVEAVVWGLSTAAGALLGVFFYGGLWWTVQRSLASKQPALWFFVSLLVRTVVVVGGLYAVSGGQLERLALTGLGFVLARPLVTWWTAPPSTQQASASQGAPHAP